MSYFSEKLPSRPTTLLGEAGVFKAAPLEEHFRKGEFLWVGNTSSVRMKEQNKEEFVLSKASIYCGHGLS